MRRMLDVTTVFVDLIGISNYFFTQLNGSLFVPDSLLRVHLDDSP